MLENIRERFKFEIWRNVHKLPQSLIDFWQLRELQRIANHAYENTVMYRELWEEKGVSPDGIETLSDMERFPIISKQAFLERPAEEYLSLGGEQLYIWKKTSGSTGRPFTFAVNAGGYPLYDIFRSHRFLCWQGFSPEAILKSPRAAIMATTMVNEVSHLLTDFPINKFLSKKEQVLKEMFQMQPLFLVSYASLLVELATATSEFPQFRNLGIKYAISIGENLMASQRKFLEETLHCEVINRYGLEEFGTIGTECRYHHGFHISVESFYLELVDENGAPVAMGKQGRIIITDFRNDVMPFIRYDTGDRGYFLPDRCRCGLMGPLLMVEGRVGGFLTLGSRKIHNLELDAVIDNFSGAVLQYQAVKIDENTVRLYIVPGLAMNSLVLENIHKKMAALLGSTCRLKIELVLKIKRTPRGKCVTLINM